MTPADANILELTGICRAFGPVLANDQVDLTVAGGGVHALVGENGAGKSTLMRIAYGELRADAGRIRIKGEEIARAHHSPAQAIGRGLGMVHQHFMLVRPMTVVENLALGKEPLRRGLLDLRSAAGALAQLGERFGLAVDPFARVEDLSVGEQQRAEILKVLWQGCDVLILDEPTAVLTPGEVRRLFEVIRTLVQGGLTVVLITHKLDEVSAIADRVTVLRRGRVVEEQDGRSATPEALAKAMVDRAVTLSVARAVPRVATGEPVLLVEGLRVKRENGSDALLGVTLAVRPGEIVGIAGVEGNGQRELTEALVGLRPCYAGRILLAGRDLTGRSVRDRLRAGLAHIPEDRRERGLVLPFSVEENLILGRQGTFAGLGGLDRARIRAEARRCIQEADLRPADPAASAATLSGGNQQKLVVARALRHPGAKLLLCAQPTRGVDIGAIEQIRKQLIEARDRGLGILLVSADLDELGALADRILVLLRGAVVGELGAAELRDAAALDRLGALMTGAAGPAP